MWVPSLGQEDSLEKKMTTCNSILAWEIPWTEESGKLQSMGSYRVRHDWSILARRQRIENQRYYFANKGPYNQSYGFSSSHVWMWELDHEEGWTPINECFWIVVLLRCESLGLSKSPLQLHVSEASVLWCSAVYGSTLTAIHDYWKTIALTLQTFVRQSNISAF